MFFLKLSLVFAFSREVIFFIINALFFTYAPAIYSSFWTKHNKAVLNIYMKKTELKVFKM